ncbi:hypothetical protein PIB30_056708 [Stylosanthes scabra]|uniref:Uncharacterized protein n=1 Tax=Stylosanthes scabra TaxID=79078 RepID=A0ABU6TJ78_9FABA|nr:hypothetical protein [Stylosanthes scabra]
MLVKSLVDIAAMLKEIKEGQQVTPMLLKRQTDHSQQNSIKYCGICSCNSHHTDECPQLQEDNLVASTHNFYSATAIPPYNKQCYTQGWKDEQQNQWTGKRGRSCNTTDEEAVQQLYEILIKETDSEEEDLCGILDFYEEFDSDYKEEESEEGELTEEWGNDTKTQNPQREMLSINTIFDKKEDGEELPIKCEDPGPCLVTCRIKGFEIPGCLCDPGAFMKPPPGERGHPQVLLGRPFLKTSGFKLTYADDIFTFSSGRIIETFQISPHPKKKNRQDDRRMRGKEEAQVGMIEALIRELLHKLREDEGLEKKKRGKSQKENARWNKRKEMKSRKWIA